MDADLKKQMKTQCSIDDISIYEAADEALSDWLVKRRDPLLFHACAIIIEEALSDWLVKRKKVKDAE